MRSSLIRYLSGPAPAKLDKLSANELALLFRDLPPEETKQAGWAKDLEPIPVKK
jgi:hypothetical protein